MTIRGRYLQVGREHPFCFPTAFTEDLNAAANRLQCFDNRPCFCLKNFTARADEAEKHRAIEKKGSLAFRFERGGLSEIFN
jgi:hypothetical protein